jgi:5-hydroxyisourate hydrolase
MISTHVLDTSRGNPAEGIEVILERMSDAPAQAFSEIARGRTNSDGRHSFECEKIAGIYRLTFVIAGYYEKTGGECFFPSAPVVFTISNLNRKYHVPLLLNPFGYSTYRGS